MPMYEKFETLVIEPDVGARMRIKQATSAVPTFGKVIQTSTILEGQEKLTLAPILDVIFISAVFPPEEAKLFIQNAKKTKQAEDAAFVLILKTQKQESSTVAQNVLVGADGLLYEPYSVDSLVEITRLASQVKGERAVAREQAAIRMLIKDIVETISIIAQLKARSIESNRQAKKLHEMCAVFDTLPEEKLATYLDIMMEEFEKAPPSVSLSNIPLYNGVSSRIKKKLEEKLVSQLKSN